MEEAQDKEPVEGKPTIGSGQGRLTKEIIDKVLEMRDTDRPDRQPGEPPEPGIIPITSQQDKKLD